MGSALAQAALDLGHQVLIVSGPVEVTYPSNAEVIWITSTEELLEISDYHYQDCQGLIGAAAPCDYRPQRVESHKISKTGEPLHLQLVETPDVVATLGAKKREDQWVVGFALETEDQRFRALTKLQKKSCNLIVLNGPQAMNAATNEVEIIDPRGEVIAAFVGSKEEVGTGILRLIDQQLIQHGG